MPLGSKKYKNFKDAPESQQIVPYTRKPEPEIEYDSDDDDMPGVLGMFPLKKPRDCIDGVFSAVKSIVVGVGFGLGGLVISPALGAKYEGFAGFCKGLGSGLVGVVVLPIAGVGVGLYQTCAGVVHTPNAIVSKCKGKTFDQEKRVWQFYKLDEDIAEYLTGEEHKDKEDRETGDKETETARPERVATNANDAQIKRAYYVKARECHPDKHPNDPEANQKFQDIGHAYQILSNAQTRDKYDTEGRQAAEESSGPALDAGLVFTMLFGSEVLEPYIGKLQMASFVEQMENGKAMSESKWSNNQTHRQVLLAKLLRDRIAPFVDNYNDEAAIKTWKEEMTKEANALVKVSFGVAIVDLVGWSYINRAKEHLGEQKNWLGGTSARNAYRKKAWQTGLQAASRSLKVALAFKKMDKQMVKKEKAKMKEKKKEEKEKKAEERKERDDVKAEKKKNADVSNCTSKTNFSEKDAKRSDSRGPSSDPKDKTETADRAETGDKTEGKRSKKAPDCFNAPFKDCAEPSSD
eukprot:Platyproteum_vivax@DN6970_c0_g2_i2.p1